MVHQISDTIEIPSDKKVVIDFFATWCGPCKKIAPYYEQLAAAYPSIVFLKVDVDRAPGVVDQFDVNVMPTFVVLNRSNIVQTIEGADMNGLMEAVKRLEAAA